MLHHKDVVHAYQPGDVAYWVNEYKVTKVGIESVIVKFLKNTRTVSYEVYYYPFKNDPNKKLVPVSEASLCDTLDEAKESAKENMLSISKNVIEQIDATTEETFENVVKKNEKNET